MTYKFNKLKIFLFTYLLFLAGYCLASPFNTDQYKLYINSEGDYLVKPKEDNTLSEWVGLIPWFDNEPAKDIFRFSSNESEFLLTKITNTVAFNVTENPERRLTRGFTAVDDAQFYLGDFVGDEGVDLVIHYGNFVLGLHEIKSSAAASISAIGQEFLGLDGSIITVEDRNADGRNDFVVTNDGTISVIHGYSTAFLYFANVGSASVEVGIDSILPVDAVGVTAGGAKVSPSGAATYTVPFKLPEGANGMTPALGVSYSSSNRVNGHLGVGWSLIGRQNISRCGQAPAYGDEGFTSVNLTDSDRLCLNGQRLQLSSGHEYWADGAEYKTEVFNYSKVIHELHNGESKFKVWTKSGRIQEFYYEVKLEESGATKYWRLSKEIDRFGNEIVYEYDTHSGISRLLGIQYGESNLISFIYDAKRTDTTSGFNLGREYKITHKLNEIVIEVDGKKVRDYIINYGVGLYSQHKRLTMKGVQECGYDLSGLNKECITPVSFDWNDQSRALSVAEPLENSELNNVDEIASLDWNGDGFTDVITFENVIGEYNQLIESDPNSVYGVSSDPYEPNTKLPKKDIFVRYGDKEGNLSLKKQIFKVSTLDSYTNKTAFDGQPKFSVVPLSGAKGSKTGFLTGMLTQASYTFDQPEGAVCSGARYKFAVSVICYRPISGVKAEVQWEFAMPPAGGQELESDNGHSPDWKTVNIDGYCVYSTKDDYKYIDGQLIDPLSGVSAVEHNNNMFGKNNVFKPVTLDYNGDGIQDILVPVGSGCNEQDYYVRYRLYYGDLIEGKYRIQPRSSFDQEGYIGEPIVYSENNEIYYNSDMYSISLINLNDSSKQVPIYKDSETNSWRLLSDGSVLKTEYGLTHVMSTKSVLADFNGDGLTDIIGGRAEGARYDSPVLPISGPYEPEMDKPDSYIKSENGDEPAEPVIIEDTIHWNIYYNKGDGQFTAAIPLNINQVLDVEDTKYRKDTSPMSLSAIDYNLDGRPDIMLPVYDGTGVYMAIRFNTGKGFGEAHRITSDYVSSNFDEFEGRNIRLMDVDSDGDSDLVNINEGVFKYYLNNSSTVVNHPQDLIVGVTYKFPGFDYKAIEYSYAKLNHLVDVNVAVEQSSKKPSLRSFVPIVKKVTNFSLDGSMADIDYGYQDGKLDKEGRGYLGFLEFTEKDSLLDITKVDRFAHNFPLIGKKLSSLLYAGTDANKVLFDRKKYSYDVNKITPLISQADREVSHQLYELSEGGVAEEIIYTSSSARWDQFGNAVSKYQSVGRKKSDGGVIENLVSSEVVENNEIAIDEVDWLISFPKEITKTVRTCDEEDNQNCDENYSVSSLVPYANTIGLTDKVLSNTKNYNYDKDFNLRQIIEYDYSDNGHLKETAVKGYIKTERMDLGHYKVKPSSIGLSEDNSYQYGVYPTSTKNNLGHKAQYRYDHRHGNILHKSVETNSDRYLSTLTQYDAWGRVTKNYGDGIPETTINYEYCLTSCPDDAENAIYYSESSGLGQKTITAYYDALKRVVLVVSGEARVATRYTAEGYVHKVSMPYKDGEDVHWTVYQNYDYKGRPLTVTSATGNIINTAYSARSNGGLITTTTEIIDLYNTSTKDIVTITETNALGQIVNVVEAFGTDDEISSSFKYDALGNLVSTTIGDDGEVYSARYDSAGNKVFEKDANAGEVISKFDAYGNIRRTQDAKGQVLTFEYDELNRVSSRLSDGKVANWYYDDNEMCELANKVSKNNIYGQLCMVQEGGFKEGYAYDSFALPAHSRTQIEGVRTYDFQQTYDSHGRLVRETYPNELNIGYEYDSQGNLKEMKKVAGLGVESKLLYEVKERDIFNNAVKVNLGTLGLVLEKKFHPDSGLINRLHAEKRKTLENTFAYVLNTQEYQWDSNGNLALRNTSSSSSEMFEYDYQNRLEFHSGRVPSEYNYHPNGNIKTKYRSTSYQYNSSRPHALTGSYGDDKRYQYDANGNMVVRKGFSIEYNSFNKPLVINSIEGKEIFKYGPSLARYYRNDDDSTTYYVAGGKFEETIERNKKQSNTVSYLPNGLMYKEKIRKDPNSGVINVNGEFIYLIKDHLGSNLIYALEGGGQLGSMTYQDFGRTDSKSSKTESRSYTSRGYTGHEHLVGSGLIHMNGRLYDPEIGRFMSPDPIVQSPYFSQSYNRYSYVWNNPYRYNDPSGYQTVYFGGAGMDGPYIPDQIERLDNAGLSNVEIGTTTGPFSDAVKFLNNAVDATAVMKYMDRVKYEKGSSDITGIPYSRKVNWSLKNAGLKLELSEDEQFNIIGYSFGGLIGAQTAAFYADENQYVDNLVLLGTPISASFLEELRSSENIGNVYVKDLVFNGDVVYAGIGRFELIYNLGELAVQFTNVDIGAGHFYYNPMSIEGDKRRDELATELFNQGLR